MVFNPDLVQLAVLIEDFNKTGVFELPRYHFDWFPEHKPTEEEIAKYKAFLRHINKPDYEEPETGLSDEFELWMK